MNPSNSGACSKCGQPNDYKKLVCDFCGARLPWAAAATPQVPVSSSPIINQSDVLAWWLQLGSFLFPILGFILYCVYTPHKPFSAKTAIQLAGVGFITNLIVFFTEFARR